MEIKTIIADSTTTLEINGKVNTTTSPELAACIEGLDSTMDKLILEMEKVDYVSSAGLRVLVTAQKKMKKQGGSLIIRNLQREVLEVIEMTGLTAVLTIE